MDVTAVAAYLGLMAVLLIGGWLAGYLDRWPRLVRAVRGWLRPTPPAPPSATSRPIESIARDLRRLRAEVRHPRPGITMARLRGVMAAYDDTLVLAARALDISTDLTAEGEGIDREAERLRVEFLLEEAGLDLG